MTKVFALLLFLLGTTWVGTVAQAKEFQFQPNCICEGNDGYINAHFAQVPFGLNPEISWFKDGDTATISAGPCNATVVLCPVRSISGTFRIQIKGSNYQSSYPYKFSVHGPKIQ